MQATGTDAYAGGCPSASRMFEDRHDAGERLAERLASEGVEADIVLAIPRGALPLGRAVADGLDAPLDVVVAKKMGAPNNPEYAIGAVASDGTVWYNDAAIDRTRADEAYVEREREKQATAARGKLRRYRADDSPPDLEGKRAVLVDDGVATGSTAFACIEQVRDAGAETIVFAVPVGPPDTIADLEAATDDVVCLETPANFRAVGAHYRNFDQVTDEEAVAYLDGGSAG